MQTYSCTQQQVTGHVRDTRGDNPYSGLVVSNLEKIQWLDTLWQSLLTSNKELLPVFVNDPFAKETMNTPKLNSTCIHENVCNWMR